MVEICCIKSSEDKKVFLKEKYGLGDTTLPIPGWLIVCMKQFSFMREAWEFHNRTHVKSSAGCSMPEVHWAHATSLTSRPRAHSAFALGHSYSLVFIIRARDLRCLINCIFQIHITLINGKSLIQEFILLCSNLHRSGIKRVLVELITWNECVSWTQ